MPKEIEVKIKLKPEQVKLLREWLLQNAKFMDKLFMTDYYLNNPKKSLYVKSPKGFIDPVQFWRLREVDNVYFMCHKKRNLDANGKTLSVEENEAITPDGEEVLEVFKKRGFTDRILIEKTRELYEYQDFEIVFDDVKNLGKFVEIELKSDEQDSIAGIKKIHALLKKIGLTEFIQFDRGYLCMALNPGVNFGEVVTL